jgi:NAD(P)-dependent dehydrogenase (short-subunit alcohol dehydrogenase family)
VTVQYGRPDRRTAVVTGASSGIGAATCRQLREQGWYVVGIARRRSPHADLSFRADVSNATQVQAAFAGLPPPSLVVHAAGMIEPISPLVASDPDEWARNIAVNLLGTFHVLRAALPPMVEAGQGIFIHVSTGAVTRAAQWRSAYCAAKAGAEHLVRVVAAEVGEAGLAVCSFNPGITETPMQEVVRAHEFPGHEMFVKAYEEGTSNRVEEVAAALVRLAGTDAASLNGRTIAFGEI